MNKSIFWDSYLSSHHTDNKILGARLFLCEKAFADHKDNISKMITALRPNTIAILGAGYLNDIPLDDLIEMNRKVYLVDWIDNVTRTGISKAIIRKDGGYHSCLLCRKGTGKEYCKNFTGEFRAEYVCTGFCPTEEPFLACNSYEPAPETGIIKADITGGVSHSFAVKIEKSIGYCKTAKEAFLRAISIVGEFKYQPIPIDDNSIELVTSSMVLSQFDVEPYTYFSILLEEHFGREYLRKHEEKLTPLMENLRTKLFTLQVESHVKEMHRIVKKDKKSRVYVSAELFRSYLDENQFFLVQDMPKALEIIGKYFLYEFGDLLEGRVIRKSALGEGTSINQSYILVPKSETRQ